MTNLNFGIQVKKAMLDKGMTASELAKELQISNSYLSEILKGTRKGMKQRDKIIKILQLNII